MAPELLQSPFSLYHSSALFLITAKMSIVPPEVLSEIDLSPGVSEWVAFKRVKLRDAQGR